MLAAIYDVESEADIMIFTDLRDDGDMCDGIIRVSRTPNFTHHADKPAAVGQTCAAVVTAFACIADCLEHNEYHTCSTEFCC